MNLSVKARHKKKLMRKKETTKREEQNGQGKDMRWIMRVERVGVGARYDTKSRVK